ncbi:hypothetical protein K504DRAFT_379487 [Pleomassaria siparia CBS 279.74]|uniref:Uncharacterized protein n=1 Tax=Pleomassaria siparia CBS 279.74 TaxID=1314801 RepID=A0A6G1KAP9_9PLEO|nr:hypothetical protein K504DRAFT_379487 [Pleomassaria siparia CBS 279.74]
MSWNFTVHKINQSFERLAGWYRDFMHRTEQSFQMLHRRILYLEGCRDSTNGPTDEQVERVLRKILAERFADPNRQRIDSSGALNNGGFFVERPHDDESIPKVIPFDMTMLQVDVTDVPSKDYLQTLQMLESDLEHYPQVDLDGNTQRV